MDGMYPIWKKMEAVSEEFSLLLLEYFPLMRIDGNLSREAVKYLRTYAFVCKPLLEIMEFALCVTPVPLGTTIK